eukprot:scaffold27554_cov102-Isochrysis_galbana.AAC.3
MRECWGAAVEQTEPTAKAQGLPPGQPLMLMPAGQTLRLRPRGRISGRAGAGQAWRESAGDRWRRGGAPSTNRTSTADCPGNSRPHSRCCWRSRGLAGLAITPSSTRGSWADCADSAAIAASFNWLILGGAIFGRLA